MKKAAVWLTILACVLSLAGCSGKQENADILDFPTICGLITEKGCTEEECLARVAGQHRDAMVSAWGEPDGMLFGLFGDIWDLRDEGHRILILYYDQDGIVEAVRITGKPE